MVQRVPLPSNSYPPGAPEEDKFSYDVIVSQEHEHDPDKRKYAHSITLRYEAVSPHLG